LAEILGYPNILSHGNGYFISWFPSAMYVTKYFKVCLEVGCRVIKFLRVKLFKLCSMNEPLNGYGESSAGV
jgi:hypothetical protein